MIVADTHALIWLMEGDSRLSTRAGELMRGEERVVIPAISLWEIALLVAKGRVQLSVPVRQFLTMLVNTEGFEVAPLSLEIAVRASLLAPFQGDPADRLIAATAIELDAPLITRDERMHQLTTLRTIW